MPIPKPRKGEKESDYVSRCISIMHKIEHPRTEKERKQIQAICYNTYRRKLGLDDLAAEIVIRGKVSE